MNPPFKKLNNKEMNFHQAYGVMDTQKLVCYEAESNRYYKIVVDNDFNRVFNPFTKLQVHIFRRNKWEWVTLLKIKNPKGTKWFLARPKRPNLTRTSIKQKCRLCKKPENELVGEDKKFCITCYKQYATLIEHYYRKSVLGQVKHIKAKEKNLEAKNRKTFLHFIERELRLSALNEVKNYIRLIQETNHNKLYY